MYEFLFGFIGPTQLLLLTCCAILWYYFYVVSPYSKFPSLRLEHSMIYWILTRKRISTVAFKHLISQGKLFQSNGLFVAWLLQPFLFIYDEEIIKTVDNNTIDKAAMYKLLVDGFGNGLFMSNGDLWRKRRKMMNPVFRMSMLKDAVPIFNKHARYLVNDVKKVAPESPMKMDLYFKTFSFNVLLESIFGISPDDPFFNPSRRKILDFVDKACLFTVDRMAKPWLYFLKLFPSGRQFLRDMKELDKLLKKRLIEINEERRLLNSSAKIDEREAAIKTSKKSLAEILNENHLQDPSSFSLDDLVTETKTIAAAGYDTVSVAFNWCLFLLGNHPEVQDRLYEELKPFEDNDVSFDDLNRLTYLECVILETLRLYPSVPFIGRNADKNIQCGKYKIPKDTTIVFFIYWYHRNPINFPDPDKFDPERYLHGRTEKRPWTYLAFSAGLRNCIGQKYAIMEMKIALSHILRQFKVTSCSRPEDVTLSFEVMLKPEQPLLMKLTPRDLVQN